MFKIDMKESDRLLQALEEFQGDAEKTINEVLHNEAGNLAQDAIKRLMPVSGKSWRGKRPAAKKSNSLRNVNSNLAVTVTTKGNYQYLYFPDDGSSTRRHAGNQQFFAKGGENVTGEIVDRCINKLITKFESEV